MSDPVAFRWKRFDDSANYRNWGPWHRMAGDCPACCCSGPHVCPTCGGRNHHDPVDGGYAVIHSSLCEACRKDDGGDLAEIEEQR